MRAGKKPRPPLKRARPPSLWERIPTWGKWAAAATAIMAFLGAIAGHYTSLGLPYPAWRPAYDEHISTIIEQKVSTVDKKVGTIAQKADRNNFDQLETKIATLDAHESLLRAQLTAMTRDKAFQSSFSLQNQAEQIKQHIHALQQQRVEVQKRLKEERGY